MRKQRLPLVTVASQQMVLQALQELKRRGELKDEHPRLATIGDEIERLGFERIRPNTISKALIGLESLGYIHRPFVMEEIPA